MEEKKKEKKKQRKEEEKKRESVCVCLRLEMVGLFESIA